MLDLDALAAIERRLDGLADAWAPAARTEAAAAPRPAAALARARPEAEGPAARCPFAPAAS